MFFKVLIDILKTVVKKSKHYFSSFATESASVQAAGDVGRSQ
jgi:hypothetical protein